MAVPAQTKLHRPILEFLSGVDEASKKEIVDEMARRFSLSDTEIRERTPSGGVTRLVSNAGFALSYLKGAGLVAQPARNKYKVTIGGKEFLREHEGDIQIGQLQTLRKQWEEGKEDSPELPRKQPFVMPASVTVEEDVEMTPDEQMESAYKQFQERLVDELSDSIAAISPEGFEKLVVALLVKMGYGQPEERLRSSRDGGIDGVIKQDALGLEKVYVQAKRWNKGQVGDVEIRSFSGRLDPHGATKGVFITNSTFSQTAKQTAKNISVGNKVIRLIDGPKLASLMIEHGVGVVNEYTYNLKKLDENYFVDE